MKNRFRRFRSDSDLKDELRAHFDALVEDGMAEGLSIGEARRRARLQLGSSQSVVERVRELDFSTILESWWRDFTLGLRSLRRSPVFAITAILTLAVGIGANTVVFTLLHGLLLRSLPVQDPAALVSIGITNGLIPSTAIPYQMLLQIRRQQGSFTDIAAWSGNGVTLEGGDGDPQMVRSALVTGNGFDVFGLHPYLGRLLTVADDVPGGPANGWPVVLSYGLWKDRFGGDPSILGRQLRISDALVTVVGVAPSSFKGMLTGWDTQVYLPFQFRTVLDGEDRINAPDSKIWTSTIGRLKPGISRAEAQAELAVYQKSLFNDFIPAMERARPWWNTAAFQVNSARTGFATSFFIRVYERPLYLMQGLVGIVLLLCCVNIAGLLMSRVHTRQQEFAVRTAIGAARWRLVRQSLTESFVIALAGAALGAAAAWYGTAYLMPFFRHPNQGIGMSIQPDNTVFLITGFFAVLTTLLFGTLPAWRAGSADPGHLLKSRTSGGSRRQILGRMFIPVQVGLSFALVSIATLLSQSLAQQQNEKTGFDLDHVTIQTAPLHFLSLAPEVQLDLYHRMKTRMEQLPGVNSASFTMLTPMTSFHFASAFQAVDDGPSPPEDSHMPYNEVGPGYFRTMNTTILAGREFAENERDRSVCILNQLAAAYLFPRSSALGRYVRTDIASTPPGPACRVIGIALDAKFANLHEAPPRTIYFPAGAETVRKSDNLVFLINSPTKAQAIAAYRKAKEELSPTTPYVLFVTLREQMEAALGSQRAMSLMSNFFAVLALFLSALGLYGLLSSSVTQRTGEIGIRMALGAERGMMLRMILSDAFRLLALGIALGGALLAVAVQFADKTLLYGVSTFDPLRLAAITAVLAVVAALAGLIPALRAASVDPIRALRAE